MAQVLAPSPRDTPFASSAALAHRHPDATVTFAPRDPADGKPAASIPSSAPSSPRPTLPPYESSQPSLLSTPSSSLSLDEQYQHDADDDGDLHYPAYHNAAIHKSPAVATVTAIPVSRETVPKAPRRAMPDLTEMPEVPLRPNPSFISVGDDTAVKKEPSRHVDYLSHAWREEDIWSSWRHIVANRKNLEHVERLENASWRTWAKSQRRLSTVSPDKLNWMKDHDVTWLYGPLQTVDPRAFNPDSPTARSRLSRTNSFCMKKPILKRRNISEAMLQRSLSNSTLVRQAVAYITSQVQTAGPSISRFREHVATPAPSPHESADYFSSSQVSDCTSTSLDPTTPGTEKRHISFNNKVEQCIAVDKDADDMYEQDVAISDGDESSDDGVIMMHAPHSKERKLSQHARGTPRGSFSNDGQPKTTIAMLPSTTLKYRGDTPEPPERANTPRPPSWSVGSNSSGTGRKLHHSSSAETLKPTRPSNNFLVDDDDEDPDVGWQPSYSAGGIPLEYYEEDEELEARGMRRTPSGMFMPYDEDEEEMDAEASGLLGRVVDTVNTARDIAHVIWNVGWRR